MYNIRSIQNCCVYPLIKKNIYILYKKRAGLYITPISFSPPVHWQELLACFCHFQISSFGAVGEGVREFSHPLSCVKEATESQMNLSYQGHHS